MTVSRLRSDDLPAAASYGHTVATPVHFDDLDPMGVLHNARYSVLVEHAITSWWSDRGVSYAGGAPTTPDAFNVVRDFAITYHRPVRGTGQVNVHFWLERVGGTSADYRFRVLSTDGATVHAEGRRLAVRVDPATMRPAPWTDHGRELASALVKP
ncbi:thioesterase family protein [Actinoplanes sp. NBRC 103695]|uniref:acyl-CoA thioesterase n=1 Tax=Actinoplanes sp. NBRC 103695 TaxID=3032202 RepID=UPI0024A5C467|nr:thioesterase family protein [Actinoplanes sp. NBRC 103695]GLY95109.1 thioesterase [Actinoplanes sp. NBRC 103695]